MREEIRALDRLPPEIADLTELCGILIASTRNADLRPLAGLSRIEAINAHHTGVGALHPFKAWGVCATST